MHILCGCLDDWNQVQGYCMGNLIEKIDLHDIVLIQGFILSHVWLLRPIVIKPLSTGLSCLAEPGYHPKHHVMYHCL